jgi:hypothetical protein
MQRARAEDLHPAEFDLQKDGTYPDKDGSPDVQILQRECQASTYNHSLPQLVVQKLAGHFGETGLGLSTTRGPSKSHVFKMFKMFKGFLGQLNSATMKY